MSDDKTRELWRMTTIRKILAERDRQIKMYGHNDDLADGTGPDSAWLLPFTSRGAERIELVLRDDYLEYEDEAGKPTWLHLVREEVAEAFKESDPGLLMSELVQVAALCVSWCEQLAMRGAKPVMAEDES